MYIIFLFFMLDLHILISFWEGLKTEERPTKRTQKCESDIRLIMDYWFLVYVSVEERLTKRTPKCEVSGWLWHFVMDYRFLVCVCMSVEKRLTKRTLKHESCIWLIFYIFFFMDYWLVEYVFIEDTELWVRYLADCGIFLWITD